MKIRISVLFCLFALISSAQERQNPYGLAIVNTREAYLKSCKENPDHELVELKKGIPNIRLDIRYASRNNFMKQVMYSQARAFVRKPVLEQLKKIQKELNKQGYGLKIYDAYRPYAVTLSFYRKASDKNFVADPRKGSKHNRGCAVDLTLISLKTMQELPMPTPYDSFSAAAAASYSNLSPQILKNRTLLISVMHRHGFRVIPNEWWHFDFIGWESYPLMDIPFQEL